MKSIHCNQRGFYIYREDMLLSKIRTRGSCLYGCTKCRRVFDTYDEGDLHTWDAHRGFADVRIIR